MVGVLVVAVGVEWNRTALVVFLVPVALGLLVPVMDIDNLKYCKFLATLQKT
jgi:hypothetical protein